MTHQPASARSFRVLAMMAVVLVVAGIALLRLARPVAPDHAISGIEGGEWPAYGGSQANAKYSPLDQINRDTIARVKIAWRWSSPDNALTGGPSDVWPHSFEATPLMVGGVLFVSTALNQVAAIDAASGQTLWVHDPGTRNGRPPTNFGFIHRGVAYWSEGSDRRILMATGDAYLIALDAETGLPIPTFGQQGRVDLTQALRRPVDRARYGVSSPPAVCRNIVIVGSNIWDNPTHKEQPPGDVRGFDVRTGRQVWTFQTIPQAGEIGNETWEGDSWKYTGNTNVWSIMSVDEELGYVYLPVTTPTNDFYGGHRLGNNLFAESLVCLDAATGKRVWHYQAVHHGLWDYDFPAAPNLVNITVGGRTIKAVAQVSKQAFVYVFDRVTGAPIWPIEERTVPQSRVPGERTSATQPSPTRPAPFDRQGVTEDDLIDFTPELRQQARRIIGRYDHGPLFTPPSERGAITVPGWVGGASWAGAGFDPQTGMLYVPSVTFPVVYSLSVPNRRASNFRFLARGDALAGPDGLPLFKPPYGRITAIDLNRGEHVWMTPLGGGPRDHPAIPKTLGPLGWPQRGFVLVTRSLLFGCWEGRRSTTGMRGRHRIDVVEPKIQAFDKLTGALLWSVDLPSNASGSPMTYVADGKQFVVVAVGGAGRPAELVALSLP